MKLFTTLVVAAAMVVPTAASAQRITTPGTFERHEAARQKAEDQEADERQTDRQASNEREQRQDRVPAAKAGKVNVAAPVVGAPN